MRALDKARQDMCTAEEYREQKNQENIARLQTEHIDTETTNPRKATWSTRSSGCCLNHSAAEQGSTATIEGMLDCMPATQELEITVSAGF